MTEIQQLIDAVHAVGGTLRADPPDLVIGSPERVPAELKARLRERKPELIQRLQLEASMIRLEVADIRIAIWIQETDAGMQVTEGLAQAQAEETQAMREGDAVIYTSADMWHYIQLEPHERRMLHQFKKRFGGKTEWREKG